MVVGLNTEFQVKCEFQINNDYFFNLFSCAGP